MLVAACWAASRKTSVLTSTEATVGRRYVPCASLAVDRPRGGNCHAHADRSRPTGVECSPHSRLVCACGAFLCFQASNAAVVMRGLGLSRRGWTILRAYKPNAPRSVDWLHSGGENGLAGGRLQAGRGRGPGGQAPLGDEYRRARFSRAAVSCGLVDVVVHVAISSARMRSIWSPASMAVPLADAEKARTAGSRSR